jgi:hypothetical protein
MDLIQLSNDMVQRLAFFLMGRWIIGFYKRQNISWPAEQLLAFQKDPDQYTVKPVSSRK